MSFELNNILFKIYFSTEKKEMRKWESIQESVCAGNS